MSYYIKVYFYIFFLSLEILYANTHERLYGLELTFSNQNMIDQTLAPTQRKTIESELVLSKWKNVITEICNLRNCSILETQIKGNPAFKITFEDGFWIEYSMDPSVLEVTMRKSSRNDYLSRKKQIEEFIFNAAKDLGLQPHERIGGGHISIDMESGFHENALLLRNFIVDRANHPELAWGLLGNHLGNAPPFSALRMESKIALYKIIHDFDLSDNKDSDLLLKRIITEVYTNNPYDWSPNSYSHYQDLNFDNATSATPKSQRRLEVRGFAPQMDFNHFIQELELMDHNLDYLTKVKGQIPLEMPPNEKANIKDKVARFQNWLSLRGLNLESYKDILLPNSKNVDPMLSPQSIQEVDNHSLYGGVKEIFKSISTQRVSEFVAKSKAIGSDNRYLIPIPKMISKNQFELLQKGTTQRLRAIKAFLDDLQSEKYSAVNAGIIPMDIVKRISIKAEMESLQFDKRENIGFFYAPDIVQNDKGEFIVLEDNLGNPGGMADSWQSRQDFLKLLPEYTELLSNNAEGFAKPLSELLRANAHPKEGDLVLIIPDSEIEYNRYFIEQLKKYGIYTVTKSSDVDGNRLTVENDIPYLIRTVNGVEKRSVIGAAMIRNYSYSGFSNEFPNTYRLADQGRLPLIGLPYKRFDMVSDKETTGYIEELVRFYLKEEPILKTAKTLSFRNVGENNKTILRSEIFDEVFNNIDRYVIKDTQGLQGHGVWIGKYINSSTINELKEMIRNEPGKFIAQEYINISKVSRWISDIRVHAAYLLGKIVISDVFWGRALSIFDNGKLNTHQNSGVVPIYVSEIDEKPETEKIKNIFFLIENNKFDIEHIKKIDQLKDSENAHVQQIIIRKFLSKMKELSQFVTDFTKLKDYLNYWPINQHEYLFITAFIQRYSQIEDRLKVIEYFTLHSNIQENVKNQLRADMITHISMNSHSMDFKSIIKNFYNVQDVDIKYALISKVLLFELSTEELTELVEALSTFKKGNFASKEIQLLMAKNMRKSWTLDQKTRILNIYPNEMLKRYWKVTHQKAHLMGIQCLKIYTKNAIYF